MLKILIVEDDLVSLNILSNKLSKEFDIYTANNGKEGLESFNKISPDIIITDIQMPEMTGVEMVKEIRKNNKNCKIIILTHISDLQTLLMATELQLTKYSLKPLSFLELQTTLEICIEEINNYSIVNNNRIIINNFTYWDNSSFRLIQNGQNINLTNNESKFISLLTKDITSVKTYEYLVYEIWFNDQEAGNKNSLKTLISQLRKKISIDFIENVFGIGYKIQKI